MEEVHKDAMASEKSWDSPVNESFLKRKLNSYYGQKFDMICSNKTNLARGAILNIFYENTAIVLLNNTLKM